MTDIDNTKRVATVGTFDGVHRGHLLVIDTLLKIANRLDATPLVFTFNQHPLTLIAPQRAPKRIITPQKEIALLKENGVEVISLQFDQRLRQMTARQWLTNMKQKYNVQAIVMGFDNTFGSDGIEYSLHDYQQIGHKLGMEIFIADRLKGVSSSIIRKAIQEGRIQDATDALGREFQIEGTVIQGQTLGRRLGFPTANITPPEDRILPPPGVYAAYATLGDNKRIKSIVNIGYRPTVANDNRQLIEAHLIDWDGNIYGREITITFIQRIREEKRFQDLEALKNQITTDTDQVRHLLTPYAATPYR